LQPIKLTVLPDRFRYWTKW